MIVEMAMSPAYLGGGIFEDMAGIIAGHMCGVYYVHNGIALCTQVLLPQGD